MKTEKLGDHLMVVYGPPGTGKTTRMIGLLESELENQTPPDKIAFVSFTRAAATEARDRALDRFDLSPEELRWFKTLHATGYALLGLKRDKMVTTKRLKEFCKLYSYDLTPDEKDPEAGELTMPPLKTKDDQLRGVYQWGLNRLLSLEESVAKSPIRVYLDHLKLYVDRYKAWKAENELSDFDDMLVHGAEAGPPSVTVAFIDEAQDLTPLQILACYRWFTACERVYVAGDDDQSIYVWAGADPQWMMDLRNACTHHEILDQSYRVPQVVHGLASKIISRNRRRVDKPYRSAKEGGELRFVSRSRALGALVERSAEKRTTFVLVRNRMFAQQWIRDFLTLGIPYISEIGREGPLGTSGLVQAVLAADRLLRGGEIEGKDLYAILSYVPSRGQFTLPRGVKTRTRGHEGRLTRMQLVLEWQLGDLIKRFERMGPARGLFKATELELTYLDLVLKRLGTLPKHPNTRIMTIHAAKGREADTVVIDSDMAKASWREWMQDAEGENRVAYVAVTRAKDELLVCDPETPRFYPYAEYAP